jgi:hypothetical protein
MPMAELHDLLERESERFTLPPGAEERMFERGRRHERNRRLAAIGLAAVLFLAVLAIVRSALPGGDEPRPATPVTPESIAGTYAVELSRDDADIRRLNLHGRFEMRLERDGDLLLTSPRGFDLRGIPITFSIDRGVFSTDALVGTECETPGHYRPRLESGTLRFVALDDPCELRRALLSSQTWTTVIDTASDSLEGDWTATFSCEQMVRTVRNAPVSPADRDFWAANVSGFRGAPEQASDDPPDPCASLPEDLTFTFRFSNGRLWIFDGGNLTEGFDGRYELLGAHVLRFGDRIDGPFRARFELEGDRITFDLMGRGGSQPFFVATWESAPFVKRS